MLLGGLGYEVQLAADEASALKAVPRLCPDVVFVDIGVPDMGGHIWHAGCVPNMAKHCASSY